MTNILSYTIMSSDVKIIIKIKSDKNFKNKGTGANTNNKILEYKSSDGKIYTKEQYDSILKWAITPWKNGLTYKKIKKVDREIAKRKEKEWGNNLINMTNNGNWTTRVGEGITHDVLIDKGEIPRRPQNLCCYNPDWETDKYIYEVKTSNWTISGTAGEKVLGTMYKYSDIPKLYKKPLKIICIAYQEYELTNCNTKIFGKISENKKKFLDLAKSMDIEYIKFSDFIKEDYTH